MRSFKGDKKYLYWGITAFCVIAASLLFYTLLHNHAGIISFIRLLASILSPFILGYIIAYLLLPLKKLLHKKVFGPLLKKAYSRNQFKDGHRLAGVLSVFVCLLVLLGIVTALIYMIIPQLISSISTIISNSGTYIDSTTAWVQKLLEDYPEIENVILPQFSNLTTKIMDWVQLTLLPNIATGVTTGVISVAKAAYNSIIGIIVSLYVLYNHETMGAHAKKILYSIFSVEAVEKILNSLGFVNDTFMSFFTGKIFDSAIIAGLCYIGCILLKIPYALLVSAIVGVTNIIPFFGPFIGAVPSAFIILIVSPLKCLIFIIFVIVLQQIDGNFIGPKILGSSVGINGFWVMFSIILGAGLFGFWGMLLGVPVFVVIYTAITTAVNQKLSRSCLPTDTAAYVSMHHVAPGTLEPVPHEMTQQKKSRRKKTSRLFTRNTKTSDAQTQDDKTLTDSAESDSHRDDIQ